MPNNWTQRQQIKAYFDAAYKQWKSKKVQPQLGPFRADCEFGTLLGIRSTAEILLGGDDNLVEYMEMLIGVHHKGIK